MQGTSWRQESGAHCLTTRPAPRDIGSKMTLSRGITAGGRGSVRVPFLGSRGSRSVSSRALWPPGGPRASDNDRGVYLPVSTKTAIWGPYFLRADPHWGIQGPLP